MLRRAFDLQAHRGGMALTVENTLPAFAKSIELGVSTLEFDVQITKDGHAVVAHDRDPRPDRCLDTEPAFEGDPAFPYVRDERFIRDLTLEQVRTIDVGSLRRPEFPDQELSPGARIPLLSEVLQLVVERRADVGLNIEMKVAAAAPERSAPRVAFVDAVVGEARDAGLVDGVTIQSFDWASLIRVGAMEPRLTLSALTDGQRRLQMGRPGVSPWLGGLDIDDFTGSLQQRYVAAASEMGAHIVSPGYGREDDPFPTRELVEAAHAAGMQVVPWTIDDPGTLRHLIDLGVDGVITNRPDVMLGVLEDAGIAIR